MNEEEKASVKTILQGKDITKAKKDRLLEVLFECIVLFIDVPEDEDSDVDKNRYHIKLYMPNKPAKMHVCFFFFTFLFYQKAVWNLLNSLFIYLLV